MLITANVKESQEGLLNWKSLCLFSYKLVVKKTKAIHIFEYIDDFLWVPDKQGGEES